MQIYKVPLRFILLGYNIAKNTFRWLWRIAHSFIEYYFHTISNLSLPATNVESMGESSPHSKLSY